jgi:hypothetical protein
VETTVGNNHGRERALNLRTTSSGAGALEASYAAVARSSGA